MSHLVLGLVTATLTLSADISSVGYFKSDNGNRIFVFTYANGTDAARLEARARDSMMTAGRMTAAYFYPEGVNHPGHRVTNAGSVFNANAVIDTYPGYTHVFMRYHNGSSEFVSCEAGHDHALCSKP